MRKFIMNNTLIRILRTQSRCQRKIHTSRIAPYFFERDRGRGLEPKYDKPFQPEKGFINRSKQTLNVLKEESLKFKEELKDKFSFAPRLFYRHGEVDVCLRFPQNPNCLDEWVVSTDSDYGIGYSSAKLELSEAGTGIFSGHIDTTTPKDGKIDMAGYANMTTVERTKSFFRLNPYQWEAYTHMVFRVRGDGRTYLINLSMEQDMDMAFFDVHSYYLYTRGGPYWQYTKIPFSKFLYASKATVQDAQGPLLLNNVLKVGITLADKINGPFRLEIDYIGCMFDESHEEEHAYEMYNFARPMQ